MASGRRSVCPHKNIDLQLRPHVNQFVPIYKKLIFDSMAIPMGWDAHLLWISIPQYTTRKIEVELFRHLHSLSLRWHLSRRIGEVLQLMDGGTDSINNLLLNYRNVDQCRCNGEFIFSIAPTLIDIAVVCIFFVSAFNAWFRLIVFTTMILYIVLTVGITEWRTKYQRAMNLSDNAASTWSMDLMINFETLKYIMAPTQIDSAP